MPKKANNPIANSNIAEKFNFSGRKSYVDAFFNLINNNKDASIIKVICFYGSDGVGKTSLIRHLQEKLDFDYPEIPYIFFDAGLPNLLSPESIILKLYSLLRQEYNIVLPLFDYAYIIGYSRLENKLFIEPSEIPFNIADSDFIKEITDIFESIPVYNLINKLYEQESLGIQVLNKWIDKQKEEEFIKLDLIDGKEILNNLLNFFAIDLYEYTLKRNCYFVFFCDRFDCIWKNTNLNSEELKNWLISYNGLITSLPGIIWVTSQNEKLNWIEYDKNWEGSLFEYEILPFTDEEYTEIIKINNTRDFSALQAESDIVRNPLLLNLLDNIYKHNENNNNFLNSIQNLNQTKLTDLFLKTLYQNEKEMLLILSELNFWDLEIFKKLENEFNTGCSAITFYRISSYCFISKNLHHTSYDIHPVIKKDFHQNLTEYQKMKINNFMFEYLKNILGKSADNTKLSEQLEIYFVEAFRHGLKLVSAHSLKEELFLMWLLEYSSTFSIIDKINLLPNITYNLSEIFDFDKDNAKYNSLVYEILSKLLNIASEALLLSGNLQKAEIFLNKIIGFYNKSQFASDNHTKLLVLNNMLKICIIQDISHEIENLYSKIFQIEKYFRNSDDLNILVILAEIHKNHDNIDKAELYLRKALVIAEDTYDSESSKTASIITKIADLYKNSRNYEEAESYYLRALSIYKQINNYVCNEALDIFTNLSLIYKNQGKINQAEEMFKNALYAGEELFGKTHPKLYEILISIANLYKIQEKYEESISFYKRLLAIYQINVGMSDSKTISVMNTLLELFVKIKNYKQAEAIIESILYFPAEINAYENIDTATSFVTIAEIYVDSHDFEKAEPLLIKAANIFEKILGEEHSDTANTYNSLAILYDNKGDYEKAMEYYNKALKIREKVFGFDHPSTATSLNNLAGIYFTTGNYEEAEPLYLKALSIREKVLGPEHPSIATTLNNIAVLYYNQSKYKEAEALFRKALVITEKSLGNEHPATISARKNLNELYKNIEIENSSNDNIPINKRLTDK